MGSSSFDGIQTCVGQATMSHTRAQRRVRCGVAKWTCWRMRVQRVSQHESHALQGLPAPTRPPPRSAWDYPRTRVHRSSSAERAEKAAPGAAEVSPLNFAVCISVAAHGRGIWWVWIETYDAPDACVHLFDGLPDTWWSAVHRKSAQMSAAARPVRTIPD